MNTGWEYRSDHRTSLGRFSRGTGKGEPRRRQMKGSRSAAQRVRRRVAEGRALGGNLTCFSRAVRSHQRLCSQAEPERDGF